MSLIAIGGNSGSGKSTSVRNLNPEETFIIQTIAKPLPFAKWKKNYPLMDKKTFEGNRYIVFDQDYKDLGSTAKKQFLNASTRVSNILDIIAKKKKEIKNIIIDDSQYLMSFEIMARGNEVGYDKFSSIAYNFFNVMEMASSISDKLNVIFLHHTEVEKDFVKLKTSGKMFDNVVTMEGLFTVVLFTVVRKKDDGVEYLFQTNSDGSNTAKSPIGMFDKLFIPNDLNNVIKAIKDYE
jgi:hypothetical protein